jgi:FKBP-type peptidyl-prolyl cis-trans isomerase
MSHSCGKCGKVLQQANPPKCAACKSEYYCNRECQTTHWRVHKKECKKRQTVQAGAAFLAAKAEEKDVTVLASGLMYKVLKATTNANAPSPAIDQKCKCHYAGTLIDGREFDSSIKRGRPSEFAPNQVIKGWTEAMQLMKEGDKWELYIPANLAYGDRPRPGSIITPGAVLVFTLEIIEVMQDPRTVGRAFLAAKAQENDVTVLPSGLAYKVLEASTNPDAKTPLASTPCECHYAGTLIDGKEFDSSYKRGQPTTFAPNQVIPGWTEAMQLMKEGDKWELYIPSDLAYGARGAGGDIPGHSTLIFTLHLLKVKGPFKTL